MRASQQDGSYPRPQLWRPRWRSLDGKWRLAYDDARRGVDGSWYDVGAGDRFDREIVVPFPPESPESGIHDTGFHPVMWYRRTVATADLVPATSPDDRVLVHFGAVDHSATVWFDGVLAGQHVGGQTPFCVDVTHLLGGHGGDHVLVVRAEDDPHDRSLPRGKQDWQLVPHNIWYHRTSGIWQTVWTETVPALRLSDVAWTPDVAAGAVRCELTLSHRPPTPVTVEVVVDLAGSRVAARTVRMSGPREDVVISLDGLSGADAGRLLWSPENPVLLDAHLSLRAGADATVVDVVDSYFGMRSAAVGGGSFRLNGRPYYVRSVLNQGYRHDTHLASRGTQQLCDEVQVIKAMGFNAVRVHQKAEDPRFLYWADRLGLLVWGETANAGEFSAYAVELLTREWLDLLRRDRSHPSIVTWVPVNESWGLDDVATDPAQQEFSRALAALTRAVDPSRPVMSNEGWEHLDSDILGLHDYTSKPRRLKARYGSPGAIRSTLGSPGPARRRPILSASQWARFDRGDAPLMLTEFGGVRYAGGAASWGYSSVGSADKYERLLGRLFTALRECEEVAGFCYTQLIDTAQEANGLLTAAGEPKLPIATIHGIVTGLPSRLAQ